MNKKMAVGTDCDCAWHHGPSCFISFPPQVTAILARCKEELKQELSWHILELK